MKLANLALMSALALTFSTIGCAVKHQDDSEGDLSTSEAQLVSDSEEASDTDDELESGLDEPLSGANDSDPGTPPDAADDADLMTKERTNPGSFFRPAGCLTTTVSGNTVTRVFDDCTGPYGFVHLTGTIVSTYTREAGKLTVTHDTTGFKINGATVTGTRTVVYTRSGTVVTRHRTGDWTGTTGKGNAIAHTADYTMTWDSASKCITRDGNSTTTIGGREFTASVTGYERCGIGSLGCPNGGKIVLSRTKGGDTAVVTVEFLGGAAYRVTRPSGVQVTRRLLCRAS